MKTIVTVSKINESAQPYKHVEIVTSLYGEDGDDFGLASISFDQFGCFSFKVQLRYVSHTLNLPQGGVCRGWGTAAVADGCIILCFLIFMEDFVHTRQKESREMVPTTFCPWRES